MDNESYVINTKPAVVVTFAEYYGLDITDIEVLNSKILPYVFAISSGYTDCQPKLYTWLREYMDFWEYSFLVTSQFDAECTKFYEECLKRDFNAVEDLRYYPETLKISKTIVELQVMWRENIESELKILYKRLSMTNEERAAKLWFSKQDWQWVSDYMLQVPKEYCEKSIQYVFKNVIKPLLNTPALKHAFIFIILNAVYDEYIHGLDVDTEVYKNIIPRLQNCITFYTGEWFVSDDEIPAVVSGFNKSRKLL